LAEHDGAGLSTGSRFVTPQRRIRPSETARFREVAGEQSHGRADWAPTGLVLAYGVGLLEAEFPDAGHVRRVREATLDRPLRMGDAVHLEGRVESVTSAGSGHLVKCRCTVLDEHEVAIGRLAADVFLVPGESARGAPDADDLGIICPPL
jgi:hypothetical protein